MKKYDLFLAEPSNSVPVLYCVPENSKNAVAINLNAKYIDVCSAGVIKVLGYKHVGNGEQKIPPLDDKNKFNKFIKEVLAKKHSELFAV